MKQLSASSRCKSARISFFCALGDECEARALGRFRGRQQTLAGNPTADDNSHNPRHARHALPLLAEFSEQPYPGFLA